MGEGKIMLPAYKRVGACEKCQASVYVPEGGGLPAMSACDCAGGPKLISEAEVARQACARGEAEAKAA